MEEVTTFSEIILQSLRSFGEKFMGSFPSIIGAFIVLILGWLFAKIISSVVSRILKTMKFNAMAENINAQEFLSKANISLAPHLIIGKFIYWIILLLVIITASDILGWNAVSHEISELVSYLPQIFAAIVFFIVGIYLATFVKDLINGATKTLGIGAGKIISTFVFYLLLILVTLTALKQAGIDTTIITSNLLIIIGSIMLSISISYGIASKQVLSNILGIYFSRSTFVIGQVIKIDGKQGEIVEITKTAITIRQHNNSDLVIPANLFMKKQIEIIRK